MSEAPNPANAALPTIAGYRLQSRVGSGGMADVFLAEQTSLNRQVAIKVLGNRPNQSSDISVRFEREARTIARLEHPDIVGIYDVGRTADGFLYYAMPYLPNGDLSKRDLRGRPQQLVAVLRRICNALEYAHSQGVVHRDVKPENILFDTSDNARLTDFGIAISSDHDQRVTAEGRTLGSSGYMSPEQARGMRLDGRADLYSLGVVLFEMLTGDVPYHGSDSLAVALAHTQDPIPQLGPSLRNWQPVIDQALAKQPAQRFQSAREMLQAIEVAAQTESKVDTRDMAVAVDEETKGLRSPLALALAASLLFGAFAWLVWTLVPHFVEEKAPKFFAPSPAVAAGEPVTPAADKNLPSLVAMSGTLSLEERERLLSEALGLVLQGRLFEPAAASAAQRLRTLMADTPNDPAVLDAVQQFLAGVSARIAKSTAAADWDAAAADFVAADGFVEATRTTALSSWRKLEDDLAASVATPLAAALAAEDKGALPPLSAIVAAVGKRHPDLKRLYDQVAALPKSGAPMRDTGGPQLVYVPARVGESQVARGFAMMRNEVSVGEFDAFARATSRRPTRCRAEGALRAMLTRHDWRSPGFAQDSRHPAVCVSYDDAVAFANWLSARVRARYRLPTSSEWKHAAATFVPTASACAAGNVLDSGSLSGSVASALRTETARNAHACTDGARYTAPVGTLGSTSIGLRDIAGNVSEWTSDCADQGDRCRRYVALGRSYRSGKDDPLLSSPSVQASSTGAPWLGFRLVREVGVQ